MTDVVVVFHSATGRTRAMAEAVVRGATAAGANATLVPVEEATRARERLARADAIVFGCPTYMGSASAAFKAFMDSTSAIWALQGWRDKLAAAFTHSAAPSGDKLGTLTQLAVFAAQHGMVWVGLGLPPTYAATDVGDDDDGVNRLGSHLGAMGSSRPGGGKLPEGDVRTAERLGARVAEAAQRWARGRASDEGSAVAARHPTTKGWVMPSPDRPPLAGGFERINLKEIVARPQRFEHHLLVCATVDGVQLEVTTASEPLYFNHINLSDEYALAMPTGDELVDRFPLRTFLSEPKSGSDVGRYNHRTGDIVLHPEGWMHWPGRLRPPYDPFDFPPDMRRCGLSIVFCASRFTPHTWSPLPPPKGREADVKGYVEPAPPMILAAVRGEPSAIGRIGATTLTLVALPHEIAPAHGAWVVVLEAEIGSAHAPCDLVRVPKGKALPGKGIVRALVLASDAAEPDAIPPVWLSLPDPPFAPFEEATPGVLPLRIGDALAVIEKSPSRVEITIGDAKAEVPRHWLARTLFRVALHGVRLGYIETYEGLYIDDRDVDVRIGLRQGEARTETRVARSEALATLERLYRAVAPPGYRERVS